MHNISGAGTKVETPHTDPDYAPTVEVFDHLGYDEIYRGVMQLQPEVLTAGKQAWQTSAGGMAQAVQEANAEVRAAMADGWRGSAAQLASEAMQAFESLGQTLSDVMAEVGRRLGQANDAAETLRSSLSQPVSSSPDLEGALLDPKHAIANSEMQKTAENVRLDVVRVMNSVYAGVFIPTGNNVPGFPVGGMYPQAPVTAPDSSVIAPGGGSADVVTPGLIPASGPHTTAPRPDSVHRTEHPAPAQQPPADRTAAPVPVDPANIAAPAAPAAPVAPASVHTAAAQPAPAAPNAAAPQADRPAPVAPAAPAPAAGLTVAPGAPRPSSASTKPQSTDTKPQSDTKPQGADGNRKDKDQQGDQSSPGDSASGMGAGIVGGLAGGAVAFGGDTTRPATSIPRPPKRSPDDEDYGEDEYYPDFDEPTFLEPAEPDTDLVGHLEPTTPPVVGEWADEEE